MNQPIYNTIGKTYDVTRKADPDITKKIIGFLDVHPSGRYLDIGCGSENYTEALYKAGVKIDGIDISEEMLNKAKVKSPHIHWSHGNAQALLFPANHYDGAICTLATHHIGNLSKNFSEAFRIINTGRFVIFTATSEQMHQYWLWEYFPKMMEISCEKMASFNELTHALTQAGFKKIIHDPFFVTNKLQDLFLHAGKHRPEIYLDANIRQGISSFQLAPDEEEIKAGLKKLKEDIDSKRINDVIQQYNSVMGDYLFVVGEK